MSKPFHVILAFNGIVASFPTIQQASDWGFEHLPSKPTDLPWGVFDAEMRPVPPPCSSRTLDNLMKAWE